MATYWTCLTLGKVPWALPIPLFWCASWDPPVKGSGWVGVIVLWCRAESELVLGEERNSETQAQRGQRENLGSTPPGTHTTEEGDRCGTFL